VAPTISDPLCQEQLVEAAREVAKSVEGCVTTCRDVSRDEPSLRELGQSAGDVTRALNDLLNHVKVNKKNLQDTIKLKLKLGPFDIGRKQYYH
jgi:talin